MPQGERSVPLGEYPEGVSPSGRFFGDFLIGEKVTRVQGGAPAGGCRNCRPAKRPRVPHPPLGRERKTGSAEGRSP